MNELVIVIYLLFGGVTMSGPQMRDGEVRTFSSHDECYEAGTVYQKEDERVAGFICAAQPTVIPTI